MSEYQKQDTNEKPKKYTQDNLVYQLNEEEKTAYIIDFKEKENTSSEILIPRSIQYESQEFIIKGLQNEVFSTSKVPSIKFASDSEIEKIGETSFSQYLTELTIPSSVCELEEGWCKYMNSVTKLTILPGNKIYQNFDDIFVIGKSDAKSDMFDTLIFVNRDVKNVTIPPFITKIAPFSFTSDTIQKVIISPHVKELCRNSFYECRNLTEFEIMPNSELEIIGEKCFYNTPIQNLTIPSKVSELSDGWCEDLTKIKTVTVMEGNNRYKNHDNTFIIGKSDPKSDVFDVLVFANRFIENTATIPKSITKIAPFAFSVSRLKRITIPDQVREIGPNAFYFCYWLQNVEISKNSELRKIEEGAFEFTSIQSFFVPKHLEKISNRTFSRCDKLTRFEISDDSELKKIEEESFNSSKFENISIPSQVVELERGWNHGANKLVNVIVSPNNRFYKNFDEKFVIGKSDSKSDIFDVLVFANKNIRTAIIPSFTKVIARDAFSYSLVEKVVISDHITEIENNAFYICSKLKKINIPENSELQIIGHNSFYGSKIISFYVPSRVVKMDSSALNYCHSIRIVEIDENVDFEKIGVRPFYECERAKIMVPAKLRNYFSKH